MANTSWNLAVFYSEFRSALQNYTLRTLEVPICQSFVMVLSEGAGAGKERFNEFSALGDYRINLN